MSYRPSVSNERTRHHNLKDQMSILPRFSDHGFRSEYDVNSKALTLRSASVVRVMVCVVVFGLSFFGLVSVVRSVSEPAIRHGRAMVSGVHGIVASAMESARSQDERLSEAHNRARQEYLSRISSRRGMQDSSVPIATTRRHSSLLIRMAALKHTELSTLDKDLVKQYFPYWIEKETEPDNKLNIDVVLSDLIIAVSSLARDAYQ